MYGAVTLYGRTFQTVPLTLSCKLVKPQGLGSEDCRQPPVPRPWNFCGPATPGSPFELPGLGSSEFARHYYRNHGCFLFLWVLRWFTSPGSLRRPMNSDGDNGCSHPSGSPIRTSPDHSLLATPRGLSQLATSFIAFLRQGIHCMLLVA